LIHCSPFLSKILCQRLTLHCFLAHSVRWNRALLWRYYTFCIISKYYISSDVCCRRYLVPLFTPCHGDHKLYKYFEALSVLTVTEQVFPTPLNLHPLHSHKQPERKLKTELYTWWSFTTWRPLIDFLRSPRTPDVLLDYLSNQTSANQSIAFKNSSAYKTCNKHTRLELY